jgi:hypothetical protein
MRAIRERPRLVTVRALVALFVVLGAIALGTALSGGDDPAALDGTRDRLERARSKLAESARLSDVQAARLRNANADGRRLQARLHAATRRADRLARHSRRLRRELRRQRTTGAGRQGAP